MNAYFFFRRHIDLAFALLIITAGMIDSVVLGYNAKYLAGSYPVALLYGIGLAMLMTFPFFLYLLGKYTRLGFHALVR